MTKSQKSMFKKLKSDKHRLAFVDMLRAQQAVMGKYLHWERAYTKKLRKKKIKLVWDKNKAA